MLKIIQALTKWASSATNSKSKLQQLWLADCKLKSNLNDFISELGMFDKLTHLDISGNEIGDFGFNLLSKSLQVNRSLRSLAFDRSNITLQGLYQIVDALKRFYIYHIYIYRERETFHTHATKCNDDAVFFFSYRNSTLSTIQTPVNDICALYQKWPDKTIEVVKQVRRVHFSFFIIFPIERFSCAWFLFMHIIATTTTTTTKMRR